MRKLIRGIPPVDHRLLARGTQYSAITAISVGGVQDVILAEDNVNREILADFIKDSLVPIIRQLNCCNPNSIVVLDNASFHHIGEVADPILQTGALLHFLPPYSPDLNPVEQVFKENDSVPSIQSAKGTAYNGI